MRENAVLSVDQRFAKLHEAYRRLETESNEAAPPPKIQRVPAFLREREAFAKHYTPRMISIGPIHHGKKLGEDYKLMWAAMYIKDTKQRAEDLHQKIEDEIGELKEMYAKDIVRDYNDEDLAWMLFLDGCSMLQILRKADLTNPEKLHIKVDQLAFVQMDLQLLENQLPFQVLKLLWNEGEAELIKTMDKFLDCHHFQAPQPEGKNGKQTKSGEQSTRSGAFEHRVSVHDKRSPTHLLDYLRTKFFAVDSHKTNDHSSRSTCWRTDRNKPDSESTHWTTYRNMQELKDVGIGASRNNVKARQTDITFKSFIVFGRLYLTKLVVDETTAPGFLNLIAYEMCPDFRNDFAVSSYVAFLDCLIDHPNDVKDLRKAGVLHNALGSDEEVAGLFNTMGSQLVPDTTKYAAVRHEMENRYINKPLRWLNQFYSIYFSSTWAITGSFAALLALVLTAIQTWAALPNNSKQA